jgi:hypothetical protein
MRDLRCHRRGAKVTGPPRHRGKPLPFRHNELPRLCLNALRSAGQPMHVREITALVLTGKGRTSFHATSLAQIERAGTSGHRPLGPLSWSLQHRPRSEDRAHRHQADPARHNRRRHLLSGHSGAAHSYDGGLLRRRWGRGSSPSGLIIEIKGILAAARAAALPMSVP